MRRTEGQTKKNVRKAYPEARRAIEVYGQAEDLLDQVLLDALAARGHPDPAVGLAEVKQHFEQRKKAA